eukprot:TRINITY_DN5502_c0_g1_i1.p1 TRINITY_DN5502_c0_g1~~TRINITY_DN5502_c0_g1_i1.p1  ORF type:complete len:327 (-),score=51.66 TRINITY_DN5502_c0_g1_i1:12-992(-)
MNHSSANTQTTISVNGRNKSTEVDVSGDESMKKTKAALLSNCEPEQRNDCVKMISPAKPLLNAKTTHTELPSLKSHHVNEKGSLIALVDTNILLHFASSPLMHFAFATKLIEPRILQSVLDGANLCSSRSVTIVKDNRMHMINNMTAAIQYRFFETMKKEEFFAEFVEDESTQMDLYLFCIAAIKKVALVSSSQKIIHHLGRSEFSQWWNREYPRHPMPPLLSSHHLLNYEDFRTLIHNKYPHESTWDRSAMSPSGCCHCGSSYHDMTTCNVQCNVCSQCSPISNQTSPCKLCTHKNLLTSKDRYNFFDGLIRDDDAWNRRKRSQR